MIEDNHEGIIDVPASNLVKSRESDIFDIVVNIIYIYIIHIVEINDNNVSLKY